MRKICVSRKEAGKYRIEITSLFVIVPYGVESLKDAERDRPCEENELILVAPADQENGTFALKRADHCVEARRNKESAASDIFADLLGVHFLVIPADRILVLYP